MSRGIVGRPKNKNVCKRCSIEKNSENSYVNKQGYFASCCRNCENEINRERHEKNKEKVNARIKDRYWKLRNQDPYFIKKDDQKSRGVKDCSQCKIEKSYDQFYKEQNERISSRCKKCSINNFKTWDKTNPIARKNYVRQYRINEPAKYLLRLCKVRAKRKGLEFNLQLTDIIIPKICPVLHIPIISEGARWDSPTIDRIDNTKGYTKDNILVISYRANSLKKDSSLQERQQLVDFYTNIIENKQKISQMELLPQTKDKCLYHSNPEIHNELRRMAHKNHVAYTMIANAKARAKKKNISFAITEDDLVITKYCPIFGFEFEVASNNIEKSPSVDRIDSSKGYTPDNIVIVSYRANRAKGNATLEEMIKINNFYKQYV